MIAANQKDIVFTVRFEEQGNYRNWIAAIKGPANTPYQGLYFDVRISAKNGEYVGNFLTPIIHPTYNQMKEIGPIKSAINLIFEILKGLKMPNN